MMRMTLAAALLMAPLSAQGQTYGDFEFTAAKDDFTDEDRSFIFSVDEGGDAALIWKCLEDGLNVVYLFGKYLGGDRNDQVLVRYRIDQSPPSQQAHWGMFTGNEATFMPMHEVRGFTSAALSGKEIVIEVVDPLDGEATRGRMGLSGLRDALPKLPCWGDGTS